MKSKRPKLETVVLTLALILTVISVILTLRHDCAWHSYIREVRQDAIDRGINPDSVDAFPWHRWGIGGGLVYLWIVTTLMWIGYAYVRFKGRGNPTATSLLFILLAAPFLMYGEMQYNTNADTLSASDTNFSIESMPTPDAYVDVLFVGDEEFMALEIERIDCPVPIICPPYWVPASEIFQNEIFPFVRDQFDEDLGIYLIFHGWATWDSYDGTNNAVDMLEEVIAEMGFSRGMSWNGVTIDIMVAWTFQDMSMYGLGPFGWDAAIMLFTGSIWDYYTPQHEISHLYGIIGHCSHADCVMNNNLIIPSFHWQSTCRDHMINNKNEFTMYGLSISGSSRGTTNPGAGTHYYYHESTVTIYAFPKTGYHFSQWFNVDYSKAYDNPLILTMTESYEIMPFFESNDPPDPPPQNPGSRNHGGRPVHT